MTPSGRPVGIPNRRCVSNKMPPARVSTISRLDHGTRTPSCACSVAPCLIPVWERLNGMTPVKTKDRTPKPYRRSTLLKYES